jgi:peptidoglycan/LPS O-acetylase OafA/YrhL
MTAKMPNELKLGRFSFWAFGMMRMRRIYPALAVAVVASIAIGWFVTLPGEYQKHLLQVLSAPEFATRTNKDENQNSFYL